MKFLFRLYGLWYANTVTEAAGIQGEKCAIEQWDEVQSKYRIIYAVS